MCWAILTANGGNGRGPVSQRLQRTVPGKRWLSFGASLEGEGLFPNLQGDYVLGGLGRKARRRGGKAEPVALFSFDGREG